LKPRSILSALPSLILYCLPADFIAFDSETNRECESSLSRDRIDAHYESELLALIDRQAEARLAVKGEATVLLGA